MPYEILYTDYVNKLGIVVEDGTINHETSLKIPGRNATAYGTVIAENFLHLLENFASPTQPSTPVEGQLWYDSTPGVEQLKVFDGTNWVPSGGLKKATTEPQAGQSLLGDLWVDTDNQQLYLYTGSGWVLVGPNFSDGLVTGATPSTVVGTDDLTYNILKIEVAAQPVAIIANDSFTPKITIQGFSTIVPGLNLSTFNLTGDGVPKYIGTAEKAESLIVQNTTVAAGNFLRGDVASTTSFPINVQNNSGINYGINSELNIGVEGNAGIIQHNIAGSSIDVKVKNDGILKTALRVDSNLKIGINNVAPEEALDVTGNIKASGLIKNTDTTQSTNFGTGAITTAGGLGVSKNLNIGQDLDVLGTVQTRNIVPEQNNLRDIGSSTLKYANMYATTFVGNLTGNVSGTVSGRAGSADKLTSSSTFRITGDVSAADLVFDGQTGGSLKTFTTSISNAFVTSKPNVQESQGDDEFLINRITGDTGLKKINRQNLLAAVPVTPVGVVTPYAGTAAPLGWVLCYGQELAIATYTRLFDVIGYTYNANPTAGYFCVPDLRGRFPLGKDDMGGTGADNVTDLAADVLGAKGGSEDVNIQVNNLPEHKHDLRGDSGDQYYITRDVSGTPNDNEAIIFDAPTGVGAGQALPNSGGIETQQALGQAMNVMNPYMALNFIIYAGV